MNAYKLKVLVTGGAGFIGSAIILYLVSDTNNSVFNADELTCAGNLESLKSIEDSVYYVFEQAYWK